MRASQVLGALALFFAASASAQNPQVTIPSDLLLVDSVGTQVGLVVDQSRILGFGDVGVALIIDGTMLIALVEDGVGFLTLGHVYFTSTDCSGTPYLDDKERFGISRNVAGPAWTFFRPIGPAVNPGIPFQSQLGQYACNALPSSSPRALVPAERVVDLASLFIPPFTIEPFTIDPAHCVRRRLRRAE
jgi:hypothetical protein